MIEVKKLIDIRNYFLLRNQHFCHHELGIRSLVYVAVVQYHLVNLETMNSLKEIYNYM